MATQPVPVRSATGKKVDSRKSSVLSIHPKNCTEQNTQMKEKLQDNTIDKGQHSFGFPTQPISSMMNTTAGPSTLNATKRRAITVTDTCSPPTPCKLIERSNPVGKEYFYRYAYELDSALDLK